MSKKFSLDSVDFGRAVHNAFVFLGPLVLLYCGFVSVNLQSGFSVEAFVPSKEVLGALALYIVNIVTDLTRKFLKDNGVVDPTQPIA